MHWDIVFQRSAEHYYHKSPFVGWLALNVASNSTVDVFKRKRHFVSYDTSSKQVSLFSLLTMGANASKKSKSRSTAGQSGAESSGPGISASTTAQVSPKEAVETSTVAEVTASQTKGDAVAAAAEGKGQVRQVEKSVCKLYIL